MMFQANQGVAQANQLQESVEALDQDAADTEPLVRDQVVMAESEKTFFCHCCCSSSSFFFADDNAFETCFFGISLHNLGGGVGYLF